MASAWQIAASNGSIAHLQQVSLQSAKFLASFPGLPTVQFLVAYSITYSITLLATNKNWNKVMRFYEFWI